ncbi:6-phosphofructokinase [Candidatus Syntrophocurvum alkaliphilum]|uniref:ATP-dependent 6-phosphofructokinase n=1 Tax=Candidatus Syntrophocurvum alkaliphilum TaxID=2293317 RepID=A0A6I6DGU2_9FIRM|nr:6-phosphofructokinase [Candidatus Syntrophocurvum alkaliphilum]QGU00188.1 6-phosphofructokinase [Candidatus Syntrophocurvum alkaliphilum]
MHKVAVLTSGGDASGMNAAIRAVVRSAIFNNIEVYGVYQGFAGLIAGELEKMSAGSVADIIHRGGTILHTSRSEEFKTHEGRKKAKKILDEHGVNNLVVIGGNGTFKGGYEFSKLGINVIGIPATIDNDIVYTNSIGYDTAVNTVLSAINRIRDTATSHGRIFIIEVMGRDCGELALAAGVGGGAESIIIPEIATDLDKIIDKVNRGIERGKRHSIIIVAEGIYPIMELKNEIVERTEQDTRISILGHIQRGGTPTAIDRILASYMGKKAIDSILEGKKNIMIGGRVDKILTIPLAEVINGVKTPELGMFEIARILSI